MCLVNCSFATLANDIKSHFQALLEFRFEIQFRSMIQPTQAAFTCSKSPMETLEQRVKSVQS